MYEFIQAQSLDFECQRSAETVRKPNLTFSCDADGILLLVSAIDGTLQRYVPAASCARIWHPCHYSLLAGYPGERQSYESMLPEFYWPQIANDVYSTRKDCLSCAKNRCTKIRERKLRLSSLEGPLVFVEIDILGPLQKTKAEN